MTQLLKIESQYVRANSLNHLKSKSGQLLDNACGVSGVGKCAQKSMASWPLLLRLAWHAAPDRIAARSPGTPCILECLYTFLRSLKAQPVVHLHDGVLRSLGSMQPYTPRNLKQKAGRLASELRKREICGSVNLYLLQFQMPALYRGLAWRVLPCRCAPASDNGNISDQSLIEQSHSVPLENLEWPVGDISTAVKPKCSQRRGSKQPPNQSNNIKLSQYCDTFFIIHFVRGCK